MLQRSFFEGHEVSFCDVAFGTRVVLESFFGTLWMLCRFRNVSCLDWHCFFQIFATKKLCVSGEEQVEGPKKQAEELIARRNG